MILGTGTALAGKVLILASAVFENKEQVTGKSLNPLRDLTGAVTGHPELYDGVEVLTEVGVLSVAPFVARGVQEKVPSVNKVNNEHKLQDNGGLSVGGNKSGKGNNDLYHNGRKVYTGSELNQLGRGADATQNRGIEYMFEKPLGNSKAQEYQWGTAGSMMRKVDGESKNVIPALRYDNSNPRGMNFIKFDGIEVVDDQTYLIDAKRNVPYWNEKGMEKLGETFRRINEAKKQNPDIKIIYEFPDEKAKGYFDKWLENNRSYENTIDEIRIRR